MGRGLSALMAEVGVGAGDALPVSDRTVDIASIVPNPEQPRRNFDREKLEELASSIAQRGILQPIIVRPVASDRGQYQIVAGERRWRAAQIAKVHEVPVIIRDLSDGEVVEVAIIENIQRSDLSPMEEAAAYRHLIDRFGHTQEKLASVLGKSRSHVANCLRLLSLPEEVREQVRSGKLSAGHARTLVGQPNAPEMAERIVEGGLTVREAEAMARGGAAPRPGTRGQRAEKDADTAALEGDLTGALGLRVRIDHGAAGDGGRVSITYRTLDDLDALCELLSHGLQRNH
jgi:ParB family chromosome partitioning protein